MQKRVKMFAVVLVGLLSAAVAASTAAADKKPRFFVIGEGNFEAFRLPSGGVIVTNVPYMAGSFYNREENSFVVSKIQGSEENLSLKMMRHALSTKKATLDMVDCPEPNREKVKLQLEKGEMRDRKWKVAEIDGERYAISTKRGLVHPDRRKLIISSDMEKELWIYSATNDRISILDPNASLVQEPGLGSGGPPFWFGRMFWFRDGKSVAYDTDKVHRSSGQSVWIMDMTGRDRCILDSKIHGSMNLLGWTYDDRLIVARDCEIGVSDLAGKYKAIGNGLYGLLENAVSPTGERMVAMRAGGKGLAIVDFRTKTVVDMPSLPKGYFDNTVFMWSPDGTRLAFYIFNRALIDPKMPYTTGAKLAVLKYRPDGRSEISLYDSPIAGSWFYISSSVSWLDNKTVVGNLTNGTSVAMEVD